MKTQFRIIQSFLILILMVSFVGCAIPNPSKPEDALLVGRLSLEADGWRTFASCNANGKHVNDVYMYLQNCATHRIYVINSNNYGFFYWVNPKSGTYIINSFSYEVKGDDSSNSVQDLRWKPIHDLPQIQVNPGQVVNLGDLRWIANQSTKTYQLVQDAGSAKVLNDYFAQKFPKSLWLQREWISPVIVTPANENPAELYTRQNKVRKSSETK